MKWIRKTLLLLCLINMLGILNAQEHIGLKMSNFSGINGVSLNPANNTTSRFHWDINIGAVGIFAETNYGYFRKASLLQIARNYENIRPASDYQTEVPDDAIIFDYRDNNRKKYFSFFSNVMGPSVMVNLENFTFGVFTNFRAAGSTQDIPPQLNYYYFDRRPFFEQFETPTFSGAGMAWGELGLNFAAKIPTSDGTFGIGVNLKYLSGYEALYMTNRQTVPITQLPGDSTQLDNGYFEYGFTTSSLDDFNVDIQKNGSGFAFDLGAVYVIDGVGEPYSLKLGASLLDIGSINFTKNAQSHLINTDSIFWIPQDQYTETLDIEVLTRTFSYHALGDSSASLVSNDFRIWLPGAFSLQADFNVMPNFFVNATWVQRFPNNNFSIDRGNLLVFTPRFESRWLEVALPLVLHNYQKLRIGGFIRAAFLSIGSDNIGGLVTPSDFSAMDFYIALKFNPFNPDESFGGIRNGRRGGKPAKCYTF